MKRDRELVEQTRDAQWAALQARGAMGAEARRLSEARDGLWGEIRVSFIERLDAMASTLVEYRALDARLNGALGIDEFIRQARERHRNAIRRKEAMERKLALAPARSTLEAELRMERQFSQRVTELEEEEASLKKSLDAFDPEFLAVRKLIEDLPGGIGNENLRAPSLMANLVDPMLVQASKRLRKFEVAADRSFDEILKHEYQPLVERLKAVRDKLSLHRRITPRMDDDFGYGPRYGQDRKDMELAVEAQQIDLDIEMAGRVLDEIDSECRNAAVEGMRLAVESFDRRFRKARQPVRADDLDAMAEVGLIGPEVMATIMRRSGLGLVLDVAEACARSHDRRIADLEQNVRLTKGGVGEGRLRERLHEIETNAADIAWFEGIVSEEAQRVITGEGPSIPEGAGSAVAQKAVMPWALGGIMRAKRDLENGERGEKPLEAEEDSFSPPSMS